MGTIGLNLSLATLDVCFCLFVCVETLRPSQQFPRHVDTDPSLPGYYQYVRGVNYLAQGHNTAEVGFEPPTSRSGLRRSTTEPPRSSNLDVNSLTMCSSFSVVMSVDCY